MYRTLTPTQIFASWWPGLKGGIRIQFRMRNRNWHGLKVVGFGIQNTAKFGWYQSSEYLSVLQIGEASYWSPDRQPHQRAGLTDQVNSLTVHICEAASLSVLLIRNVHPGSRIRIFSILNPNFFHLGSASKNISILTQKIGFKVLWNTWSGLFIPDPDPDIFSLPGFRDQKCTGSRIRIRNTEACNRFLA